MRARSTAEWRRACVTRSTGCVTSNAVDTVVLSGGVFQNQLLLQRVKRLLAGDDLEIWVNHAVPPNDGGISLGQAALAAFRSSGPR